MEVGGGTEESPWNDEWTWVEGQRRARGMMNEGGWRDRGEPVKWIIVGSEAIDFHAHSTVLLHYNY